MILETTAVTSTDVYVYTTVLFWPYSHSPFIVVKSYSFQSSFIFIRAYPFKHVWNLTSSRNKHNLILTLGETKYIWRLEMFGGNVMLICAIVVVDNKTQDFIILKCIMSASSFC